MKNIFNSISVKREKRNRFDLSHDVKLSCNMGDLVPTMWLECVPGDSFHIGCESLQRLAPMVAPMMHRVNVCMHYWFVPYRILWYNWEQFIASNPANPTSGSAGSAPVFPFWTVKADGSNYTKLCDYLGIPDPSVQASVTSNDIKVSAMVGAAYQAIYGEFYRDQNLVKELFSPQASPGYLSDGENNNTGIGGVDKVMVMHKRAWEHDYFTAALPFAQRGTVVSIPLGTFNDVPVAAGHGSVPTDTAGVIVAGTGGETLPSSTAQAFGFPLTDSIFAPGELYARTSDLVAGSADIRALRRAFRLQEWFERIARGGSRYAELVWSMFGVRTGDARLQRPEYITGTVNPIVISEVLNTTGETGGLPQGNMSGHGAGVTAGKYGSYHVREHGLILGIMSVMPKPAYMQGIWKNWFKSDPIEDFYWSQFQNIGEQEVKNKELFAFQVDGSGNPTDEVTFGYVPRYSEYKFMPSRVAGDFRTSLDFWHMARKFDKTAPPALNQAFVECDPTFRIFAVTDPDVDHIWSHIMHRVTAIRPMQKYGNPGF